MKHVIKITLFFLIITYTHGQETNLSYPLMNMQNQPIDLTNHQSLQQPQYTGRTKEKSLGKAFFFSLMLPGMGEAYTGRTGYTRFFLTVETLAWGLLFANQLNINWQTKDFKNYAVQHAGVDPSGKDKQFWINVGFYSSIYGYNEQMRRDRNVNGIYKENSDYDWYWDNEENRRYYAVKRAETRELEGRAVYFMGAIVLNHLVSAINAMARFFGE